MLHAAIDESVGEGVFVLAAVVLPAGAVPAVTAALDTAVRSTRLRWPALAPDAEVHAHPLLQGSGAWRAVASRPARVAVVEAVADALVAAGAAVFVRGTGAPGAFAGGTGTPGPAGRHGAGGLPVCWPHLLERLDAFAAGQRRPLAVLADEVARPRRYTQACAGWQQQGTGGYRSRRLTQLQGGLRFAASGHHRVLQAADVVAYLARRRLTDHPGRDPRSRVLSAALWSRLQPLVHHAGGWAPTAPLRPGG